MYKNFEVYALGRLVAHLAQLPTCTAVDIARFISKTLKSDVLLTGPGVQVKIKGA